MRRRFAGQGLKGPERPLGPRTRKALLWRTLLSSLLLLAACPGTPTSGVDSGPVVNVSCATGCGDGLSCLRNSDFPAGACSATCTFGGGLGCASGTVCSPLLSSGRSYCLQECATSSCSDSLVCTSTAQGQVCLAPAAAAASPVSCPAPQLVVGVLVGPAADPGCRDPVVASALPAGDVQLLGTHAPGESVSFQVPAGAVGFSILSQAVSGQNGFLDCGRNGVFANEPVPTPVLTPPGTRFFDVTARLPLDRSTAPLVYLGVAGQQPYVAALTFPNTSAGVALAMDGGLEGGQWTFDVNDYANEYGGPGGCDAGSLRNSYDVEVVVTPGPLPTGGQLDVDIYLATNTLTASEAPTLPEVQRFASRFSNAYANAGICLGSIAFHDLPEWAKDKYSLLTVDEDVAQDPCSDYRQMFTLAAPGRTMALFFVDSLEASDVVGEQLAGIDGAIPGMAAANGTIAGGAAMTSVDIFSITGCTTALDPVGCGPDFVGLVAAHETGHFLGLFHTSEQKGDSFDPLADTASCVCALCETNPGDAAACGANPDGGQSTLVDNTVCNGPTQQCGGANLLMFWILSADAKGDITPEQSVVMRSNPLLSAP